MAENPGRSRRASQRPAPASSPRPATRARARAAASTGAPGGPGKPKRRGWRLWLRRLLWTGLIGFALGVIGIGVAYALIDIPKPNEVATAQVSIVYYADGKNEMGRLSDEYNREPVSLDQVPLHVRQAFIGVEQRDFYESYAVSPPALARAVWGAVTGRSDTGGGSTITQQWVKNYYLTQDRSLIRKLKEIMISIKVEQQMTKDEILESYLNTIYFGRNAYGIKVASRNWFNKDVSKLSIGEGAFLAMVVNRPSALDPWESPEVKRIADARWGYTLDGMVAAGFLTQAKRDEVRKNFPMPPNKWVRKIIGGTTGYLMDAVRRELGTKLGLSDTEIDRGGLKVVSSIDLKKQKAAVAAVDAKLPKGEDLHVGLVSVKPGDGAIEAMYAGADFAKRQRSTATQDVMQPGSTFKIFTLIAALESGKVNINRTRFDGHSPRYFKEFRSADDPQGKVVGHNDGWVNLQQATATSNNMVYAELNILTGPDKTAKAAADAGVTSKVPENYANVLGTSDVTVLEMADAYATIAAEGVRAEPYLVARVTSADGTIDEKTTPKTTKAFEKDLMRDVIACMRTPVRPGGTASQVQGAMGAQPVAGKTGTTLENYAAWFDGFSPQLATAVGIYRGDGSRAEKNKLTGIKGVGDIYGGNVPADLWVAYMKAALEGVDIVDFPDAVYINQDVRPTVSGGGPPPTVVRPPTSVPQSSVPSATESSAASTETPTVAPTTEAPTTAPPPTTVEPTTPVTSAAPTGSANGRGQTQTPPGRQ